MRSETVFRLHRSVSADRFQYMAGPLHFRQVRDNARRIAPKGDRGSNSPARESVCRFDEVSGFNRRGLFLGGCPKSGTTLLLSLLDGHPGLVVLPEETHYLEEYPTYAALDGYQAKLHRLLEKSGLRLLGKRAGAASREAPSANLRDYSAFDHHRFAGLAASFVDQPWMNDSLLFSETARAYAIASGSNWRNCARWVEKSTSNEVCAETLFKLFPDAKLLQVVRDPRAVFASRKRRLVNRYGCYTKAHRLVREWNRSCRLIPKLIARRDQYLLVHYVDLVRAPRENLDRICQFLGIELVPEMFAPTRAGRQWQGNSSFHDALSGISAQSVHQWKSELTEDEVWWIEIHCREGMRLMGYQLQTDGRFSLRRWLKRLPSESWSGYLRARRGSLCQIMGLLEHCRYDTAPAGMTTELLPDYGAPAKG
jgi:hypothetical protein